MYCIIWFQDNRWQIFTNEIWDTEKEATEYAKRGNFKRKINGKLFYTTENIINSYGYK